MTREELREKVKSLPKSSGVYIMKDNSGTIIYVGKAKILRNRVKSYFDDSPKTQKTYALVSNIHEFEYILTESELDAFSLESNLIHKHKPKYNILLKDDKSFPYLAINTKEKYPRVQIVRRPKHKPGVLLFGPYVTGTRISSLIEIIKSAFPIRTCNINFDKQKKAIRPCLHGEIGNCSAPCRNLATSEEEYQEIIKNVIDFLNGKTSVVKSSLKSKMDYFASELKFEEALDCRNKLEIIEKMSSNLITSFDTTTSLDVFGTYETEDYKTAINVCMIRNGKNVGQQNFMFDSNENGESILSNFIAQYYAEVTPPSEIVIENSEDAEIISVFLTEKFNKKIKVFVPKIAVKKQLLENTKANAKEYATNSSDKLERKEKLTTGAQKELAELLGLESINRIEGFDISNISGTNNVASMVVFVGGEPAKQEYRKFKIQSVEGANDFACMKETLNRRAKRLLSGDEKFSRPDLIMIDGGLGQLHKAKEAMEEVGVSIPMVSLAERDEEIYTTHSNKPIRLPKSNYALRLLIRVRDEAHRFAVSYHRNLRGKSLKSVLLEIEGLGENRIKKLYEHFKTIENITSATPEDIAKVEGIGAKLAISIYSQIHS